MTVTPPGRHWRTWAQVGAIVFATGRALRGTLLWPPFLVLRVYFTLWDRVLFRAWWWWGWGEEGIGHLAAYRRLEEAWGRLYLRLTIGAIEWVRSQVGD